MPNRTAQTHTPGPWVWDENRRERKYADIVLTADAEENSISIIEGAYFVSEADSENEANARLIAAAPDLLDAAKAISEWYDVVQQHYPEMLREFKHLRTAVAKATEG